tara:strand:+ start:123 stop:551 length:429 start_codon:yes stop_codon:yes gene_type:complete
MPDKIFITWTQIQEASRLIADNARDMEYKAVIGIQRGGLIPAVIISHELDIPMYSVNCSLRDHVNKPTMVHDIPHGRYLCVDDINDTGETFRFLQDMFDQRNLDIDYAVIHDNIPSEFSVDYWFEKIDKDKEPTWIVYPWEK